MKKYLFYAMEGEKMCFVHVLLNALDLAGSGHEVKIIFEGASVKLPPLLEAEGNQLYRKALADGLVAGVCQACAETLGVRKAIDELGLPLLSYTKGHAGMRPYIEDGYEAFVF